jgi:hypothetical protein
MMGLGDAVAFEQRSIDLRFVRSLPQADLLICLNLIHHAGAQFDIPDVELRGWEEYACEWLAEVRGKCKAAVIGTGFKLRRPLHWDVSDLERPRRFADLAARAGWSLLYDANVEDIRRLGVRRANGRWTRTRSELRWKAMMLRQRACRRLSGGDQDDSRRGKYHIFVLG